MTNKPSQAASTAWAALATDRPPGLPEYSTQLCFSQFERKDFTRRRSESVAAPVRLRVDDNLLLAHRIVVECQFVLPTEEESAALR
ncbi:MAG: hypothetical protein M1557_03045, partial [Actinobacteria bacterium]|nr:hypothetical protein [Actinomycetota bacterium]